MRMPGSRLRANRMAERTLGEWLQYLERLHPSAIDLGLSRVAAVARDMALLPFPMQVLTVAGTNGKGSVVYSSEAILRHSGLRTGLYTSPHILRYNERIMVDGQPVDDAQILAAFEAIEAARGNTSLTYFEFSTLAALWVFRQSKVHVAILEVGLGGRLDAVNIVDSDVAVVTAIDLDHQHWLGDTVEKIAREKAAIARPGRPVVLAERRYPTTLFSTLASIGAARVRSGDDWSWQADSDELRLRFAGRNDTHVFKVPAGLRASNVAAALQASRLLLADRFNPDAARAALGALEIPGRCQQLVVQGRTLVLDVAHNPAAMGALAEYLLTHPTDAALQDSDERDLQRHPHPKTVAAIGVMADKDMAGIAGALAPAVDGACALAIPAIPRAAPPETVWEALDAAGIAIPQSDFTLEAVWAQLLTGTVPGDRIVVCGSFHTVAGIMALLALDAFVPVA